MAPNKVLILDTSRLLKYPKMEWAMDFDYWILWACAVFYCFLAMLAILYLQVYFYKNAKNQKFINREDVRPIKKKKYIRIRRHRHRHQRVERRF